MKKSYRKSLLLAAKCLVAAALLAWLLSKVDLREVLRIARNSHWGLLALGAAGFVLSLLVTAVRWWMLLRIQRIRIRVWEATRLTFLGQFFNSVVPGIVGGDLIKAYYVSKHTPKKAAVLLSVFVDRVMGLTELTLMAAGMIAFVLLTGMEKLSRIGFAAASMAGLVAIVVVTLSLILSQPLRKALRLHKLYQRLPIAHHFAAAGDAAVLYRRRLPFVLRAVLVTFGAHVLWIGGIAMLGYSLSLPIPVYSYFVYVPLIYVIGAVPLTPGGVGIVESCYVLFLSPPAEQAGVFALAILARFIPILWSLPGAIVAVTGPKLPKAEAMQAELGLDQTSPS